MYNTCGLSIGLGRYKEYQAYTSMVALEGHVDYVSLVGFMCQLISSSLIWQQNNFFSNYTFLWVLKNTPIPQTGSI